MAEPVIASGSEKRKGESKAPSFNWTDSQTITLMLVLKDYHTKFGYNKSYDWAIVNKAFFKRTGIDLSTHGKTVARNKVEHMKKLWRNWSDLRFKVTGAGWDESTGMVTLTDECWESFKKSDNSKYLHFRTKGVDPELCALWDEVFGTTMATGKNVMAPCMKKKKTELDVVDLAKDGVDAPTETHGLDLDSLLDRALLDDEAAQLQLVSRVRHDAPFEECLNSVYDSMTTPLDTGSGPSKRTSKSIGKMKRTSDSMTFREMQNKKRKSASTSFNEHMQLVSETGKKMLSIMEGECESTILGASAINYAFADCFAVVERMVQANLIRDESKLWSFPVTKLGVQETRNQFMELKRDSARLTWLKYEYETTHKIYDPIERDA